MATDSFSSSAFVKRYYQEELDSSAISALDRSAARGQHALRRRAAWEELDWLINSVVGILLVTGIAIVVFFQVRG